LMIVAHFCSEQKSILAPGTRPTSCADHRRIASSRSTARTLLCEGFDVCVMLGRVETTAVWQGFELLLLLTYKYQPLLMCIRLERFTKASARAPLSVRDRNTQVIWASQKSIAA
jgi:hypothetical protein